MRGWSPGLLAAAVLLCAAAPAQAGTAYVTGNGQAKTLHYDAAAGETNNVSVNVPTFEGIYQILDFEPGVPLTAGQGCSLDPGGDRINCSTQGIASVAIDLGDGNDSFSANLVTVPITADGGEGNDSLPD